MGLFRYTWRTFSRELTLLVVAIAFAVPMYIVFTLSLKSLEEVYLEPLKLPTDLRFGNYRDAWNQAGVAGFDHALLGSLIITVSSVVSLIILGSICAYALARRPTRVGGLLYILFVLGIILPFQLAIIPLYVVLYHLGLTGTYLGMVILNVGLFMPVVVFLYTGFIRALPKEYEEAAQVDGAGLLRTWFRVVFPLMLPVTGTVAVLVGLWVWNEFFLPVIFLYGSGNDTIPLAIYGFQTEFVSDWHLIMAGIAISLAPAIAFYLFAQKQLIHGFAGGLKG